MEKAQGGREMSADGDDSTRRCSKRKHRGEAEAHSAAPPLLSPLLPITTQPGNVIRKYY